MMGGPPSRNLAQDYDEMQQRSTERRDQIVKEFDERIAGCEAARAEMQQGFARANEARDQGHGEDRIALANRQRESFERLVNKGDRARRPVDEPGIQGARPRRQCARTVSDAMNDDSNGVTGVTALVILVLSFLIPGWAARALGLAGPLAHLLDWMTAQEGLFCVSLWLIYGLAGFCVLLALAVAVGGAGLAVLWGLRKAKAWVLRTSVAIAQLLGLAVLWLAQMLGELLWDVYATQLVRFAAMAVRAARAAAALPRGIRRRFPLVPGLPSFLPRHREGRRSRRAARREQALAGQAAPDPVEAAIRLLGLPESFTSDDLKRRFRTLIKGVHPDLVGPNELATQLNDAHALIKERKGWT